MNFKKRFLLTSQDYYEQVVRPLNKANAEVYFGKRINLIREIARKVEKKKVRFLDVGCGQGDVLVRVEKELPGFFLYGVDLSSSQVKVARKRIKKAKLKTASAEKLPYQDNYFDLVFINALLHHVDDISKVVKESVRACVPGGYVFIIEPNRFSPLPLVTGLLKRQERGVLKLSKSKLKELILEEPVKVIKETWLNSLLFPFQKFPGQRLFNLLRRLEDSRFFPDFLKSHFVFVFRKTSNW